MKTFFNLKRVNTFIILLYTIAFIIPNVNASEINSRIAYLSEGNIWIMDEDGENKVNLTNSANVIAFTHYRDKIYYTEITESMLFIYESILNSSKPPVTIGKIEGEEGNGITEGCKITLLDSNTLLFSCNFSPVDGGFQDQYGFNIAKKKLSYTSLMDEDGESRKENFIDLNDKKKFATNDHQFPKGFLKLNKTAERNTSPFFSKKVGKEYELFRYDANFKEIKISNTQNYTPRVCWEEEITGFSYMLTPSRKVVFNFISGCGDLEHAHYFIANMDGTHQRLLVEHGITNDTDIGLLDTNGGVITLSEENLVTYAGVENKMQVLANNVKYFELLR